MYIYILVCVYKKCVIDAGMQSIGRYLTIENYRHHSGHHCRCCLVESERLMAFNGLFYTRLGPIRMMLFRYEKFLTNSKLLTFI